MKKDASDKVVSSNVSTDGSQSSAEGNGGENTDVGVVKEYYEAESWQFSGCGD